MKKKRNMQDATLLNIRALKNRVTHLEIRFDLQRMLLNALCERLNIKGIAYAVEQPKRRSKKK
jgi:hypothetical protein